MQQTPMSFCLPGTDVFGFQVFSLMLPPDHLPTPFYRKVVQLLYGVLDGMRSTVLYWMQSVCACIVNLSIAR